MEQKSWKVTIEFREITDDNGNVPLNAPIEYRIDLTEAKGLDCDAVISSGMTLVETMINHVENVRNEKNSLQLDESQASN